MNFEDIKSDMKISFDLTKKVSGKVEGKSPSTRNVKILLDGSEMPLIVNFDEMSNISENKSKSKSESKSKDSMGGKRKSRRNTRKKTNRRR
jgi:hypothetical protein